MQWQVLAASFLPSYFSSLASEIMEIKVADYRVGQNQPLLLIAGPCVIESAALCHQIASHLAPLCAQRGINYVFKASFDKANRTSLHAARGAGLESGLQVLADIKNEFGVPVTTDIHEREQCEPVAKVCDILQIPAFLCRQTDLIIAASRAVQQNGGALNIKKGQFLAPEDTRNIVVKARESGCENVMLCERGTTFGYGNLVVDFRGLEIMREWAPVCFDATHSVQKPGGGGDKTSGDRRFVPALTRAAMAVGADALFVETHPNPDAAWSDGPNMVPLQEMAALLDSAMALRECRA